MTNIIMVGAIAVLVALIVIAAIISRIIYICPPNEVLIFSGGHRRIPGSDERVVGYRVVQGGRGIRIPLIEIVDRMDLTNMAIELRVTGAYSKGGIPLSVRDPCSAHPLLPEAGTASSPGSPNPGSTSTHSSPRVVATCSRHSSSGSGENSAWAACRTPSGSWSCRPRSPPAD